MTSPTSARVRLRGVWLTPDRGRPLLVVGPSLGTGVVVLWNECAERVGDGARPGVDVLGWDLPGHGAGEPLDEAFTLEDLASAVVDLVDRVRPGAEFIHAGVSVAGAVGLALASGRALAEGGQDPARVRASAVICSGAKIGSAEGWAERADVVRRSGTAVMVEGSRQRWFAPGSVAHSPERAEALLRSLTETDKDSYARVCEALGRADFRADLAAISIPVLVMGGRHDAVVDPESQQQLATALPSSVLVIVEDAAHLAPAESPAEVAQALSRWIGGVA